MNKTTIKNFAIWARNKLIADITYKAGLLGITEKEIKSPLPQSTKEVQFFDIGTKEPYSISGEEIKQRGKLVELISSKSNQSGYSTAYTSVIEEVAYTWFNRLIAIRFMEVNDYLPSRIRVLSSESSTKIEPDLVTKPFESDLEFTPFEKDQIIKLTHDSKLDELFRILFTKQCNALNNILPHLFEKTSDYTELLLNVSFTDREGVVFHLVNDIDENDFNIEKEGQVEIIGWLYQYYNTEPKDEAFALLKKNVKITKDRIPAMTQLFTPDWIVRYMVENSVGRLWLEGHPNENLKSQWKYYLEETSQQEDVKKQLEEIRKEYRTIKPEDIKIIDPCMGSGHILVYAFDVLMYIYETEGYSKRDAAKSIIANNIYGLDIDNRAYQLAYFAVIMKARQYNRRIFEEEVICNLFSIQESNELNREHIKYFGYGMNDNENNIALINLQNLLDVLIDAKEYGSILNIDNYDWELLYRFIGKVDMSGQLTLDKIGIDHTKEQLFLFVKTCEIMAGKYDVVITNPPYVGSSGMNGSLREYLTQNYPMSKSDLCAVFIEKCIKMAKPNRKISLITMHSWMFLSSLELVREIIINDTQVETINHVGMEAFDGIIGKVVSAVAFCLNNNRNKLDYKGTAVRLTDFYDSRRGLKESEFFKLKNRYFYNQRKFLQLPGIPIAYWASDKIIDTFKENKLKEVINPKQGTSTGNDEIFVRHWTEINFNLMNCKMKSLEEALESEFIYFPIDKGGAYRKWYGNNEKVIKLDRKAYELLLIMGNHLPSRNMYFKRGLTWSKITSGKFSMRYDDFGFVFSSVGLKGFPEDSQIFYVLGYMNSSVCEYLISIISPGLSTVSGDIEKIPIIIDDTAKGFIDNLVIDNIAIAKKDWDGFETSWDFKKHPLNTIYDVHSNTIKQAYDLWDIFIQKQILKLKSNEEKLNSIFIDIYNLHDELIPNIENKYISITKTDLSSHIRSFISYAVGCMVGRYSLDVDGLIFAGGKWDDEKYTSFIPNRDNILPITDEEYFEDDIVSMFCLFVKTSFGEAHLEENLNYIANALNNKGNSAREIISNYFAKDFFKDHCKVYQKRPIYWLFDSGKADGFKALIYMHRYDENTIGNLRIDYLHKIQRVYDNEINRMKETIDNSSDGREVAAAQKRKEKLIKQLKETKEYDEKIAHLALARIAIDLDDGVKVNYEKVQTDMDGNVLDVLAKI